MDRDLLLAAVSERLGRRRLVWSGLRGEDVEPLVDLPQLHAVVLDHQPVRAALASVEALAHEDLTGVRPDLEVYDIDDHLAEEGARRSAASPPAHVVRAQRAAALPGLAVPLGDLVRAPRPLLHLGLFGGHQSAFEHKPWVETSLAGARHPTVPWTYVADEEQLATRATDARRRSRRAAPEPHVGWRGFVASEDPEQLADQWPRCPEAFVSMAPYLRTPCRSTSARPSGTTASRSTTHRSS